MFGRFEKVEIWFTKDELQIESPHHTSPGHSQHTILTYPPNYLNPFSLTVTLHTTHKSFLISPKIYFNKG
ncbi:hypothetical protein QVD17_10637 [Tagetes erecta]|uniref:Uncharacterized protein n=1 Tax=Tagetes erecta TaxID=13708 RepID=A0AAD8L8B9_TARER|nr:hypothetical protein QVD17_10637 [Tagetes erecta]